MSQRPVRQAQKKAPPTRNSQGGAAPLRPKKVPREAFGWLLLIVAALTALGLSRASSGALLTSWAGGIRRLFGWGAYPVVVSVAVLGLRLCWREFADRVRFGPGVYIGLELLLLVLLAASHAPLVLQQGADAALTAAEEGRAGGYVGWAMAVPLMDTLGAVVGALVLLVAFTVALGLLLPVSRQDFRDWVWRQSRSVTAAWNRWRVARQGRPVAPELPASAKPRWWEEASGPAGPTRRKAKPQGPPWWEQEPAAETGPQASSGTQRSISLSKPGTRKAGTVRPESGLVELPPLDLLDTASPAAYGDTDVRRKVHIIEETLASFGVPARVVEVSQGPTVTQFGLDPGYIERRSSDGQVVRQRVRVARIAALTHDLALALAASPIRIEAPVPGRSIVGLEVPNDEVALVSLRAVIESPEFQRIKSPLAIALGENVAGQPVAVDLGLMPHLLIAGATGSGKSVCVNAVICSLLLNNRPQDLRMLMVDPKMVELVGYNGIPHLMAPVVVDAEQVVGALNWVARQMDERYRLFHEAGCRNLEQYNRQIGRRRGNEVLPRLVVLVDELADLMMVTPDEVERCLCRVAQLGRATGIHLVVATQRPSVDVVTGLIKANFPARISFAVTSQVDSRVILDQGGAESLLGRGDMLFVAPQQPAPVRLQGCFVSDAEIERLTAYWQKQVPGGEDARLGVPWLGLEDEADSDALLEKALEVARGRDRISTSFIQRQLRIGFPRAARLMEQMEEQGLVGSDEGAGRGRQVLFGRDLDLDEIDERLPGVEPR